MSVVVVGGGMAGAACASALAGHGIEVTLVDRHDYSQFQPLLYQVASSQLPAEDIARPLRTMFRDRSEVTVVTGEVVAVDVEAKTVTTDAGTVGPADQLVIAAGARPNFFGVPGAAEHAIPLYSVRDAERLRRHLRDRLRGLGSPEGGGALTIVVCGGGATGVEISGALAELLQALRDEGRLAAPASVRLVDLGHALLAPFTDRSHRYALDKLTAMGVEVTFGVAVTSVDAGSATLSDGSSVVTDTVIWAGGISGASLVDLTGIPAGRGGRIDVARDLTVPGHPGVFAVGDVANVPDAAGGTLPQLGSVAQQSGAWAGKNVRAQRDGAALAPFHYHDKGIMAMIGRNTAVAEVGPHRHQLEGPFAFAAWLGLHGVLMSGFHDRVDAVMNWADDYLHHARAADLELEDSVGRIAWADDDADRPDLGPR
ncbi:NAD(P)/FAD-dependent oxidoreductase [Isoptericola sp. F-RaC21]|uniref:NAD(P)/FAD-dependent oxidoreductase n=1 Tax=Isoptericola sp. F-RaC21 TaxID=3141452 RepID=UPI00315BBD23